MKINEDEGLWKAYARKIFLQNIPLLIFPHPSLMDLS